MKKVLVILLTIVSLMALMCACGTGEDEKSKAGEAAAGAAKHLQGIASGVLDKAAEINPIKNGNGGDEESAEIQPVDPEFSVDSESDGFLDQLNDFVYNMTEAYPDGDVTVEEVLEGIKGDDLMEVINDILTDPTKIPDGDKPDAIIKLDELLQQLQNVVDDMIGGLNRPQPR